MTAIMEKLLVVSRLGHVKNSAKQRDLNRRNTGKDNRYKELFSHISAIAVN